MPLPDRTAQWPPARVTRLYEQQLQNGAWYSGDPVAIADVHGTTLFDKTKIDTPDRNAASFWSRRSRDTGYAKRGAMHVPLPGDLAATSADLLFGEPPSLVIEGNDALQNEIDQLAGDLENVWLEAAELASAFGGVYLRPAWDMDSQPRPFTTVVRPDAAVPTWRHGHLRDVLFWTELGVDKGGVYRHLELHEMDGGLWKITHALYVGDKDVLGSRVGLQAHPATENLEDEIRTGVPWLGVQYVPNMRPNRRLRTPDGRSDYEGSTGLFDALDETWNSWMRDLRLAAARLVVPEQYLDFGGAGNGQTFDVDRELFAPINVPTGMTEGSDITLVQFEIRVAEHSATSLALIERIVSAAGYSPQDFGLHIEGRADSGTALRQRRQRSLHTTSRKQRYWTPQLDANVRTLQQLNATLFGNGPTVADDSWQLDVQWQEPLDMAELSATASMLRGAMAASTRTLVRLTQPQLPEADVDEEVARIQAENSMAVDDPLADLP